MVRSTALTRFRLAPNPGPMSLHGTNSYVIARPGAAGTVVVDPGPLDEPHLQELAQAGAVELILITHRHADHTAAAARFSELTGAPVRAMDPPTATGRPPSQDGEIIHAAGVEIRVLATPGHTSDSVCFHLPRTAPTARSSPATRSWASEPRSWTTPTAPWGTTSPRWTGWNASARRPSSRPTAPCCPHWTPLSAPTVTTARPARTDPLRPSDWAPTPRWRRGGRRVRRHRPRRAARGGTLRGRPAALPARWTAEQGPAAGDGTLGAMRIARFVVDSDPLYGIVEGEPGSEEVTVINGDPFFHGVERTPAKHKLEDVRLLAPIIPRSKVIGVGRNFVEHAQELGNEVPEQPLLFLKPNTSVIGPNDPIVLPEFSEEVSFEAELCVVIGRICKDVPEDRVDDVIFGYTCGNDLTARDVQKTDLQWARAKGFDTSAPLGPWIETELNTEDLQIQGRLNGELRQDGSTNQMIRGVRELVSIVSQAFTLLPGDVIMTGTPAGVGLVQAGDRFEVEIEGIGRLSNPVVRR